MPSFDAVSEVQVQEVRNAVDQSKRELRSRFDFRGVDSGFELESDSILVWAEEEFQVKQLRDILEQKLAGRRIDVKALVPEEIEHSGKQRRQRFRLLQGIDRDTAREIVALVKKTKLKLQSQIQGEKVRVSGKKRDDLQEAMAVVRKAELSVPIQFRNFRD